MRSDRPKPQSGARAGTSNAWSMWHIGETVPGAAAPDRIGSERDSGCGALPAQPAMASTQMITPSLGSLPASEARRPRGPATLRPGPSGTRKSLPARAAVAVHAARIRRSSGSVVLGSLFMISPEPLVRSQEFRDSEPILDASFRTRETDAKLDRDRQAESMGMPSSLARCADRGDPHAASSLGHRPSSAIVNVKFESRSNE